MADSIDLSNITPFKYDPASFASYYQPVADQISANTGIDSTTILGQLGLETGWGQHIIPGTNNPGNIKDFSGSGTSAQDNQTGSTDNYRQFDSLSDFANAYSNLIANKYPNALNTGTDANATAKALKAGGYAQDPNYVSKIINSTSMVAKALGKAPGDPTTGNSLSPISSANAATSNFDLSNITPYDPTASTPSQTAPSATPDLSNVTSYSPSLLDTVKQGLSDLGTNGLNNLKDSLVGLGGGIVHGTLGLAGDLAASQSNSLDPNDRLAAQFTKAAVKNENANLAPLMPTSAIGKIAGFAGDVAPSLLIPGGTGEAVAAKLLPEAGGLLTGLGRGFVNGATEGAIVNAAQNAVDAGANGTNPVTAAASGIIPGALIGGPLGTVASGVARAFTPSAEKVAGAQVAPALADLDPAQAYMALKIKTAVDNLNDTTGGVSGSTQSLIDRLASNADSAVPDVQRTAADAAGGLDSAGVNAGPNPIISQLQQGLAHSDYKGALTAQDVANNIANNNYLQEAAVSPDRLAAVKAASEADQNALFQAGSQELPAVTGGNLPNGTPVGEAGTTFASPQMQQFVKKADVLGQNEGNPLVQDAIARKNAQDLAGIQGAPRPGEMPDNPAVQGPPAPVPTIQETPEQLQALIAARNAETQPLYNDATSLNAAPLAVDDQLRSLLATPPGQQALRTAQSIRDTSNAVNGGRSAGPVLQTIGTDEAGNAIQQIHPADVQNIKKALDDMIEPNPLGISSITKAERGPIIQVKNAVNSWLGNQVPEYAAANAIHAAQTPAIEGLRALQGMQFVDGQGNVALQKLDAAVKKIQAARTSGDITDPLNRGVSDAKLNWLINKRAAMRAEQGLVPTEGLQGHAFEQLRLAATNPKTGEIAPEMQAYLTRRQPQLVPTRAGGPALAPSYVRGFQAQARDAQAIAQQEAYNNIAQKVGMKSQGNGTAPSISWPDLKEVLSKPESFSGEHLARLQAIQDNIARANHRYEAANGPATASNLSSAANFQNFIAPKAGFSPEHNAAALVGIVAGGHLGGPLGSYIGSNMLGRLADKLTGAGAAKTAAATAANADALTALLKDPKHLAEVLSKINVAQGDKAAIKGGLLNRLVDHETTAAHRAGQVGGILGSIIGNNQ